MAKQLNVNLAFTADSSQAKKELQDLQNQLSKLTNAPLSIKGSALTDEIMKASNAASELQAHLSKAINTKTGNLDFTKLTQSIQNSGSTLAEYGAQLQKLGPQGQQAFQALATSVAKAEIPIHRSNAALAGMWTTLKNTARWQISSSILHGFLGAVQSAYGYAQDLNESLNNIRIVTGQNTDQMAKFAEQANKAARALSTTTTEYTNASLIYYQQGLDDSEVAKRTEITIKMANAAGQSAQVVSDQLTAVWNNFAKGGENLEYYADVMTALGAATASSTDEISEGLNKFASVAETVGLSYEYAASALATVTATTRQSADVVGTAFKTLFARIQDLELGKTLDDGTTLGHYSQALQKVGVDIKDANGEMKSMDTILSEMAAKWDTLNKDQQVALAQSVAGVRQYTQLIALMDNWDFMESNISTARNSSGTLDKQEEIYAESWEAAQKRVKAAAEAIYSDLIDDDFFIEVLNNVEKLLGLIDHLLDSMGGIGGALAGISALVLKIFDKQIAQGLTNMVYNLKMLTQAGREAAQTEQQVFVANAAASMNPSMDSTIEGATKEASMRGQLEIQAAMIQNAEKMSGIEIEVNKNLMDRLRLLGEESAKRAKAVDEAKERTSQASLNVRAQALDTAEMWSGSDASSKRAAARQANDAVNKANENTKINIRTENVIGRQLDDIRSKGEVTEKTLNNLTTAMKLLQKKGATAFDDILKDLPQVGDSAEVVENKLRRIEAAARDAVDELADKDYGDAGVFRSTDEGAVDNIKELTDAYREEIRVTEEKNESVSAEQKAMDDLNNRVNNATGAQKTWADTLVGTAQGISSMTMGITSLVSGFQALSNPDLSGWEKFTSVMTSFGMAIPMMASGFATLKTQIVGMNTTMAESIAIKSAMIGLYGAENTALITSIALDKTATEAEKIKQLQEKLGMTQEQAANALKQGTILAKTKNVAMTIAEAIANKTGAIANKAKTAADAGETAGIWAKVAAKIAELAVSWPLLAVTLLIVAALAALAAIVFVVVSAFQSLSAAYNKDAIAAENAENAAKGLAEAYNEAKQSYEDMVAAMNNYKSAREGLDSLTEGTLEYQEALNKANEAALEVIKMGNLIKDQDYTIENGEIIIKDEAMESAKQNEFNKMMDAQAASTMANAKAVEARAKANQTELVRSDNLNAGGGAAIGTIVGSFIPVIGPVLGGAIGAIGTQLANDIDDSIQRGKIEELTALYDQIGEAAFDSATLQELGFDTANQAYIDSVKDVVRETNAAAEQMEVAAELAAAAVLEKNEAYQNSEHQDKIAGAAGKGYQAEYEKAYEEAMKQTKNNDWFGVGSKENKTAMEEYAKQMGLNDLNGFKVTNYKKGGNVEYEYIDENGQKQTVELTQQQIAAQLAATEASERLAEQTQTLLNTFNRLEDSTNKADQALADFASGDLSGASKSEFEDMESELADSIITDEDGNRTLSDQGALDYINANFSAEELQAMGYASAEEAAAAFKQQFDANLKAWDSIELPENLIGTGDMSLKTAQNFENALTDINLGPAGEQAGKDFVDGINKMVEGLNTEDQQAALEELSNIDWSDWDALEQADAIMKEYGVDIDTTSQEWIEYANKMRQAAGATPDFSKLRDTLTSITAILQDLDFGSVISDEDYQKLVQYNDEWERYFMLQADGSRVFIGDSQAMQQEVRNNIIEQRKALQERKAAQEGFDKANWGHEDADGNWIKADWGNKSGSDTGTATNLMNASGATEDMLEELGYTDEVIQDMITKATSGQADLIAEGEAAIREMYQRIDTFTEEELAEMDAQFDEMMASTATNVTELQNLLASDQISEEAYDKQLSVLANKAKTLEELQQIQASGLNGKVGLDTYEYGQALLNLASNYENCADEAEEYSKALLTGDEATIKAAQSALEAAIEVGELAEKYDLNGEQLDDYAKRLKDLHKDSNLSAKDAAKLAAANMRLDRGLSNLNNNLKDYKKKLSETNKGSAEWSKALSDLKTDLADVLNVADGSMLSDAFAEATLNSEDLKKALDGDVEALQRLQTMAADDIIATIKANIEGEENMAAFQSNWDYLKANMQEAIKPNVDQTELIAAFNDMIAKGNMTKEQIEAALAGLHVSANVKTTYVSQKQQVPLTITETAWMPNGTMTVPVPDGAGGTKNETYTSMKRVTRTYDAGVSEADVVVPQYEIEGTEGEGGITTAFTAAPAPTASYGSTTTGIQESGGGGGGGGGDSKPASTTTTTKKADIVDRYKELEDALDDVADALEDASKQADRLYGKSRIDKLKQMNGMIQQEIGLLKNKLAAAKQYLAVDKQALEIAAQKAGVSFSFDSEDNITNYTQEMEKLYEELRAAQDAWNADYQNKTDEEQQEYEENIIQPIQDKIDELKEAIAAYEETRELIEDLENQIDDKFYEWQDNNYEILHYELEIEIEINDLELEYIDYYLNKITDDFYSMAEAAQYMNNQIPIMTDSLGQYENFYNEITAAYAAGEISQAAYVEGMQESYSAILDQLSALNDLDKEMMHYYEETLDAASEELSYYTDQMEHLTSVLEHYRNIVELVNGEFDYESIGTILEGQATTLKNELDVATVNYQMLLTEQAAAEEAYRNAQDEAARELYAEELKAITAQVDEAHDLMLSKTEEWAEAQKAIMENAMAQAAHQMEEAFTDGMGFDALNDSLDRLNSYADEYLTKTNQIYETQTLINTAQKAIDKTTNEAAKARLKSYQEEIQSLQEKNKLSNLELEIAKAKYDVLLAEIALEEAQNAKATVRLQRDNEGNYGYVYTADQEAISQAEQDLMDAENALYNIGLEGANEYGQKLLELQQQLADQLIALEEARAAGQFATDAEYYAARDQLIAEYTDLFTAYSEQYTTALGVDAAIQEEAWVNAYDEMIKKTGDWQSKVTYYTEQCENSYEQWRDTVESESEVIDSVLNDLESEVKDVTDESTALKDEVVNKVIPAMKNQLVSVRDVTSAYAQQRAAIQQLISYYEQLTQSILAAIQAQAGLSDSMGEGTESGTDDFDTSIDYSKRMYEAWQAKDMEAYEQAKKDRNTKISLTKEGDYGVSTARLDAWIKSGGGYDENGYFTDEWLKKHGYATGGYTGAWGPEGRLAWVHEKELMLNPEDTVNFLNATHLLRDIVDIIDINALRNQVSVLPYLFGNYIQGNGGELQQHVQIEAHFPGVTDRHEIEEAFNNLVNTASQYANRKY